MKLTIRAFAGLAERLGGSELTVDVERDTLTVSELKDALANLYPGAASLIAVSYFAKNQSYARPEELVTEKDELALIPPVSGGQGCACGSESIFESGAESSPLFTLTSDPISVESVTAKINHPNHGTTIAFVGTTREFTYDKRTIRLVYEAYEPMALETMKQIGEEVAERWPGTKCAITHRLGPVGIGQCSVVIAVSAPHRGECYEASRYAIERLKQIVPIWKKEIWDDSSEWKGTQLGQWDPTATLKESNGGGVIG